MGTLDRALLSLGSSNSGRCQRGGEGAYQSVHLHLAQRRFLAASRQYVISTAFGHTYMISAILRVPVLSVLRCYVELLSLTILSRRPAVTGFSVRKTSVRLRDKPLTTEAYPNMHLQSCRRTHLIISCRTHFIMSLPRSSTAILKSEGPLHFNMHLHVFATPTHLRRAWLVYTYSAVGSHFITSLLASMLGPKDVASV